MTRFRRPFSCSPGADAIRNRDSVGSWLYGVAVRVAARARASSIRRQIRNRRSIAAAGSGVMATSKSSAASVERDDVAATVHQEVSRLPEKYRAAVVLCYFEGLTHDEAAARLSWPVGTVRSRLSRARDRLRSRLTRRGVTAPSALGPLTAWIKSGRTVPQSPPHLRCQPGSPHRWLDPQHNSLSARPRLPARRRPPLTDWPREFSRPWCPETRDRRFHRPLAGHRHGRRWHIPDPELPRAGSQARKPAGGRSSTEVRCRPGTQVPGHRSGSPAAPRCGSRPGRSTESLLRGGPPHDRPVPRRVSWPRRIELIAAKTDVKRTEIRTAPLDLPQGDREPRRCRHQGRQGHHRRSQ